MKWAEKYHEQTCETYRNEYYGHNTIYNSACGPASLCNALDVLGLTSWNVRDMCKFSVNAGARGSDGTDMFKLLDAAGKKFGFSYRDTYKNAELLAHLKAGGVAIVNQGDTNKVFANGGHFVAAVGIAPDGKIYIMDSYWNASKYKTWPPMAHLCEVVERGVVKASLETIGKASIDRPASYYLITPNPKTFRIKVIEDAPIRKEASKAAQKIGTAEKGSVHEVLETSKGGSWYRVKPGWIAAKKTKKV